MMKTKNETGPGGLDAVPQHGRYAYAEKVVLLLCGGFSGLILLAQVAGMAMVPVLPAVAAGLLIGGFFYVLNRMRRLRRHVEFMEMQQQDLIDSARQEAQLRFEQSVYEVLVENAHDLMFVLDESLKVTYINRFSKDVFLCPANHLLGKHLYELFDEQSMSITEAVHNEVKQGVMMNATLRALTSGEKHWFNVQLVFVDQSVDPRFALVGVCCDITELVVQQVERDEARKNELIDSVASRADANEKEV
ncbi:MAG: PAS domain S-box protein [Spartobacteria bacterium]|nr:PAS domain S-box protein [Spartobacteria bacterium]